MSRQIVVIGAGIVGAAMAAYLTESDGLTVTVLERGPHDRLLGSTGLAPGFVGLLGETQATTELARASASCYDQLEYGGRAGLDRVGGLEIASTEAAMPNLQRRAALAHDAGLPAQLLDAAHVAATAPRLVSRDSCVGGVLYALDGTARAGVITQALKDRATHAGARFVYDAPVTGIDARGDRIRSVHAGGEMIPADDAVIACGIWGPEVAALAGQRLPLTPVAHPYVYGPAHARAAADAPFVRWPDHHVYARDHGDRLGFGTYDHPPQQVDALGTDTEQPWPAHLFDPAVASALRLLPEGQRFTPERRLNGVFAVTADNLPLVGPVEDVAGLWMAEALWVTHAAGAARALARQLIGAAPGIAGFDSLRPGRFAGQPADELTERALRRYRDIYAIA